MLTWTNQPYQAMWDHLKILSFKANVKSLLSGKIQSKRKLTFLTDDILERKSAQVAYSIGQAHQYFKAADDVNISTSPLLYFYGMLSLAKALVVANDPYLLLDNIKYHGLHTRPINEELNAYVNDQSKWLVEKEYAVTNEGVFKRLTELIHDYSLPDQSIILFKDLMAIDPQLSEMYLRYYNEKPRVSYLYSIKTTSSPFSAEICPSLKDKDDFEERLPSFSNYFNLQSALRHGQALVYKNKPEVQSIPDSIGIYYPIAGGKYLISGLRYQNNDSVITKYIAPEISDYIAMFILSNCVRYKQEFWGQVVEGKTTGSLGIINLFLSIARLRFPNFILNQLFNERFDWGTPARIM